MPAVQFPLVQTHMLVLISSILDLAQPRLQKLEDPPVVLNDDFSTISSGNGIAERADRDGGASTRASLSLYKRNFSSRLPKTHRNGY